MSISAPTKTLTLENFAPVKLRPAEEEEYIRFFFPKNEKAKEGEPKTGLYPKTGELHDMIIELASIADRVCALYYALAATPKRLETYSSHRDEETGRYTYDYLYNLPKEAIVKDLTTFYGSILRDALVKAPARDIQLSNFLENILRQKNDKSKIPYIIKETKSGFDVVFTGNSGASRRTSPLLGTFSTVDDPSKLLEVNRHREYSASDLDPLSRPVSKEAYDLVMMLNNTFTNGLANNVYDVKRGWKLLPIDFNFSQLDSLTLKSLGMSIFPKDTFTNLSENFFKFSKYFSLVAVYSPHEELIDALDLDPEFDKTKIPKEFLVLQPNVHFSISIHLPHYLVEYITQTPPNKKVSLSSLCQWLSAWTTNGFGENRNKATKYVVKASDVAKFSAMRSQSGLFVENGAVDNNNIFISNAGSKTGRLIYCPPRDGLADIKNAEQYEKEADEALAAFFDSNLCPKFESTNFDTAACVELGEEKIKNLKEHSDRIKKRSGTLLSASWDYRKLVAAQGSPSTAKVIDLEGVVPDAQSIASYLEVPMHKALALMTGVGLRIVDANGKYTETLVTDGGNTTADVGTTSAHQKIIKYVRELYDQCYKKGLVPSFAELIQQSAQHFNVKSLVDEKIADYEQNMYIGLIDKSLKEGAGSLSFDTDGKKIIAVFENVLENCSDLSNGALAKAIMKETGSYSLEALEMSNRYYIDGVNDRTIRPSKTSDIKNVYNWIGGYIFYLALKALKDVNPKDLFGINSEDGDSDTETMMRVVMPYVVLMSSYVPQSEKIYVKAERLKSNNTINDEIDVQSILVPGTNPKAQVFPHQVDAHKILRNNPRFAAIDCQAGGGKTIMTLADIACTIREAGKDKANAIKPIVVCPDGLVRNWCEDMVKLTGSSWNMIPLTTEIYNRWGQDKLDEILKDAPPNTIVVCSMSFLSKAQAYTLVIGGKIVKSSRVLEFIKNYGFNYVAIDECHRIKSQGSNVHKFCKDLCNSQIVKFVRLLSGTMIPKDVKDIVGIAAMFSGHIFRSKDEFGAYIDSLAGHDAKSLDKKRIGLRQVRERFKQNIALVRIKRKQWAFLLPSPIESFLPVHLSRLEERKYGKEDAKGRAQSPITGDDDPNYIPEDPDEAMEKVHRQIYEDVLADEARNYFGDDDGKESKDDDSEEKRRKAEEKRRKAEEKRRRKGELPEDGGDVDDGGDIDDDEDSDYEQLAIGKYNFQRIDRITMDPESDELYGKPAVANLRIAYKEKYGKDLDTEAFVPRKIRRCIERLDIHFNVPEWTMGKTYTAPDNVTYKGVNYVVKKREDGKPFQSNISPDLAPDDWNPEVLGKVLILCQYTDSIAALYSKLPEKYQEKCAKIYKGNSSKQNKVNLNSFMKRGSGVEIVICQADRVSEGFNMQAASRIIRLECPWTPGAIEQSNARLFRPAVGQARREFVYLDWIVSDATLEVVKVGKLYNRTISNCQYEESDNTDGENGANLYEGIMGLVERKWTLNKKMLGGGKERGPYPQFSELRQDNPDVPEINMNTYGEYCKIRNREFEAMRNDPTKVAELLNLITVEAPEEFKKLRYVPYTFRQEIPDPYGFEYIQLMDLLEEEAEKGQVNQYAKQIEKCIIAQNLKHNALTLAKKLHEQKVQNDELKAAGKPIKRVKKTVVRATFFSGKAIGPFLNMKAHFEGGYGIITGFSLRVDHRAPEACPLCDVVISTKTKSGIITNTVDANAVYVIPGELTRANAHVFNNQPPLFDGSEGKKSKPVNILGQGPADAEEIEMTEEDFDDEVENESENGPKDVTVDEPEVVDPSIDVEEEEEEVEPDIAVKPTITMTPVIYDEFVGVEIEGQDVENIQKILDANASDWGIKRFIYHDAFASINIHDKNDLKAVCNNILGHFTLADFSTKAVKSLLQSSFTKEGAAFNIETAPVAELARFIKSGDHKLAKMSERTGKPLLKVYPLFTNGRLDFVVDLASNPKFKPFVSKTVPGVQHGTKKWVVNKQKRFFLALVPSKGVAMEVAKRIAKSDLFVITNTKQFRADLAALKTHVAEQ